MSGADAKKHGKDLCAILAASIVTIATVSCTDMGGPSQQRRQITSCPPGEVLICTSNQPPSKGGADASPLYERCYCESGL